MSELDDTTLEETPRKKKGIPKWLLWGCGCGCLVTLLAAGGVFLFFRMALDPERQWPALQEVLYFEERPTDLTLVAGVALPGGKTWSLQDWDDGYMVTITYTTTIASTERDKIFSEEGGYSPFGMGEPKNAVAGLRDVQGREVRTLSFEGTKGVAGIDAPGGGIRIDLSDGSEFLMVELRATELGGVSDEQIEDFLGHFEVWK